MATVVLYTDPEVFAIDERLRAAYMPLLEEKRQWAAESTRVCAELSTAQMEIEALRFELDCAQQDVTILREQKEELEDHMDCLEALLAEAVPADELDMRERVLTTEIEVLRTELTNALIDTSTLREAFKVDDMRLREAEQKLAAARHELTLARAENVRLHSEVLPLARSYFALCGPALASSYLRFVGG